jgi:hypothetical protein
MSEASTPETDTPEAGTPEQRSVYYFPLRTNIGFFDEPTGYLSLMERIKQAALLYDQLIFEPGVYQGQVHTTGVFDGWIPLSHIDPEIVEGMKAGHKPTGGDGFVGIEREDGTIHPIFSGDVLRRFFCEFHSTLQSLNADQLPWIEVERYTLINDGDKIAKTFKKHLQKHITGYSDDEYWLYDKIFDNLSNDLVLASEMGVSASINAFYLPLLSRVEGVTLAAAPGSAAFQLLVPDVSHLSWEAIVSLREEESLIAFRKKLREFEAHAQAAIAAGEFAEAEHEKALAQAVFDEMFREFMAHHPTDAGFARDVAFDLALGAIPIPVVGSLLAAGRAAHELVEGRRSWRATFLKLRKPRDV